MTAVLWDDVDTRVSAPAARARRLQAVLAAEPTSVAAQKKTTKRLDDQPYGAVGDPLVEGATRLLCVPLRQLYAALWRVGLLEVLG